MFVMVPDPVLKYKTMQKNSKVYSKTVDWFLKCLFLL